MSCEQRIRKNCRRKRRSNCCAICANRSYEGSVPASRRLSCITNDEIKSTGSDLAKACVAVQRNRDADGGIVAGKAEPAFHEDIVDFIYVQWATRLAQNHRRRLGNSTIKKAIAGGVNITSHQRHVVPLWRAV